MSDRRQLRPTTGTGVSSGISKKPRKPTQQKDNDAQQRERKRALDRKAQRASREKTRSHIAHLEKMVQILSDKNGNTATSELLEEMSRLQAEIDRLRKIIDSIKSVLGAEIFESTAPRRVSQTPDHDTASQRGTTRQKQSILCEVNSPSAESPQHLQRHEENNWTGGPEEGGTAHMDEYVGDDEDQVDNGEEVLESPIDIRQSPQNDNNLNWEQTMDGTIALTNNRHASLRRAPQHTAFWNLPTPTRSSISMTPVPDFVPCKIWQKANSIYAKIFEFDRPRVFEAEQIDSGAIVKVVKDGWDTLTFAERNNPVLQILKEVDQYLFWDLDPVTKIANLFKSFLLLKYYFNAESHNLEPMPTWQRPVHSQRVRRHPIPIDFFPWPALRDRLVRHHNYYFATEEFSVHYRQHFKFSWPFSFDETYRIDPVSKSYRIAPLFERYHRDMRCWGMEESFFQKFPELVGEMSVHQLDPLSMSSNSTLPADISPHQPFDMGVGGSCVGPEDFGNENCNFADECVMQLFDDYPPTG